jgi:1-acyl-sn-glycerol-3-phosphate acyltransferase
MLAFWAVALPVAAILCFPWTFLTGDIRFLYRVAMWSAWTGVRITGIKVQTGGLEQLDPKRNYVFMSNHVSNIDPHHGSTHPEAYFGDGEKELFNYPLLGKTMRLGSLVPVDQRKPGGGHRCRKIGRCRFAQGHQHDHLRRRPSFVRWQAFCPLKRVHFIWPWSAA